MDPTYPLVPLINIICLALLFLSFSVNALQSWSTGVCLYAFWVGVSCLIIGVDTIVWSDNVNTVAPEWCDIVTRLAFGSNVGIPACSLTITRRLYKVTRLRQAVSGKNEKRKEILIDLLLCLGLPIILMALYTVVQGARFQIYEDFGCSIAIIPSGLTLIISDLLPVLLSAISVLFYCPSILWTFYHQRREINEFLASDSQMSRGNYFRVMALGSVDALVMLPLGILGTVVDILGAKLVFWPGWSAVHEFWSDIVQVPRDEWAFWDSFSVRLNEWVNVFLAVVFFVLFAFTPEARARYSRGFWTIARWLGMKRPKGGSENLTAMVFGPAQFHRGASTTGQMIERTTAQSSISSIALPIEPEGKADGGMDSEEKDLNSNVNDLV